MMDYHKDCECKTCLLLTKAMENGMQVSDEVKEMWEMKDKTSDMWDAFRYGAAMMIEKQLEESIMIEGKTWAEQSEQIIEDRVQRHINHPFYKKVDVITAEVAEGQILKGAEKYDEPFNPKSWTGREKAIHLLQELRDAQVYGVGMLEHIEELEEEIEHLRSEIDNLNFSRQGLFHTKDMLSKDNKNLRKDNGELKEDMDNMNQKIKGLTTENEILKNEIEALEVENDRLDRLNKERMKELREMTEKTKVFTPTITVNFHPNREVGKMVREVEEKFKKYLENGI